MNAPRLISPLNLGGEAERAKYFKRVEAVRESEYRRQEARIRRALDEQRLEVMKSDPSEFRVSMYDDAIEQTGGIIENAYLGLYLQVGGGFATRVYNEIADQKRFALKAPESILAEWLDYIRELIRVGEVARLIQNVQDTTKVLVRQLVAEAMEEGIGPEKLQRMIRRKWLGVNITRARRIARTETIRASNWGQVQGARSTGLELKKEWIRSFDARTRDSHRAMDRHKHVELDGKFLIPNVRQGATIDEDGETIGPAFPCDYPGDPALPASESVQCRCTVAFVTQDL